MAPVATVAAESAVNVAESVTEPLVAVSSISMLPLPAETSLKVSVALEALPSEGVILSFESSSAKGFTSSAEDLEEGDSRELQFTLRRDVSSMRTPPSLRAELLPRAFSHLSGGSPALAVSDGFGLVALRRSKM